MALAPTVVGDAIATLVAAAAPAAGTPITPTQLKTLWEQISAAMLTGTGGVTSGVVAVSVASVTLVTPGAGASGPGSGSGTIS